MSKFSEIWDKEVKKLAIECIQEPRYVELMTRDRSYKLNKEEREYIEGVRTTYKDSAGMYYISKMIWKVEHALADNNETVAGVAIAQIHTVLSRESYLKNVFNGNTQSKEWKTRDALCKGLKKLIES